MARGARLGARPMLSALAVRAAYAKSTGAPLPCACSRRNQPSLLVVLLESGTDGTLVGITARGWRAITPDVAPPANNNPQVAPLEGETAHIIFGFCQHLLDAPVTKSEALTLVTHTLQVVVARC